jgi:hypothetical protein
MRSRKRRSQGLLARLHTASRWLALLLTAHIGLGLVYGWATPIFEAPDEGYHFAVVRWLALGNGLPVQEVDSPADWAQEGSQPPLYHWMAAGLASRFDLSGWNDAFVANPFLKHVPGTTHNVNQYRHPLEPSPAYREVSLAVYAVRWLSLGLSIATIALAYVLSLAVYPARQWQALLAAGIVAFTPQVLFINAAVNNDNLLMLLSTAALVLTLSVMRRAPARPGWRSVALGLALGLAALTKLSGLVLWPVVALALVFACLRRTTAGEHRRADRQPGAVLQAHGIVPRLPTFAIDVGSLALHLVATFSTSAAVVGWWFWRNYQLYGEWLGLNTMVAIAGPRQPEIGVLDLLREEAVGFFLSFWGVFGVFTIRPAGWVYWFFGAVTILALAGGAWLLVRRALRGSPETFLLATFCALTLVGVIRWTLQTPASQGRLMFGAIAPLAIFMAAGIFALARPMLAPRLGPAWARTTALVLSGLLAAVAGVIPVAYIAPRYAPPARMAESDLPTDLRPVRIAFGEGIELIGYTVGDEAIGPAETLPVTLYWRRLAPMSADFAMALVLFGRGAETVGQLDTWPGGGLLPTSSWAHGAIYADSYQLPVDAAAEVPTTLKLAIHFWHDDPDNRLAIGSLEGNTPPSVMLPAGRLAPRRPHTYAPQFEDGTELEYGIRLLGYDVNADGAVSLTLYWQLSEGQAVPGDFTVMRHLVDEQGIGLLIADSPPQNGDWPTSAWLSGHVVADEFLIALPLDPPPGRFDIAVGLYDPNTGARVAAVRPDGVPWPDDVILLRGVRLR